MKEKDWYYRCLLFQTVVGFIILSVAMLTAVTTSVTSLYDYLVQNAIEDRGDWHAEILGVKKDDVKKIEQDQDVAQLAKAEAIGYAPITNAERTVKPYFYFVGLNEKDAKQLRIKVTKGTYPTKENEILISDTYNMDSKEPVKIGDTIKLKVGVRKINQNPVGQETEYDENVKEEVTGGTEKEYKIVGICERTIFEDWSSPGYGIVTINSGNAKSQNCFVSLKKPKNTEKFINAYAKEYQSTTNTDVLRYLGVTEMSGLNNLILGFAVILILIIMVGSISLIYNAFSISISERTKAFGLLSSIGATKKQLKKSVHYEVGFLCLFGIPLGILSGIVGISITFQVLNKLLKIAQINSSDIDVHLQISWLGLLITVLIGIVTVAISARIPTIRAVKMNPIDAIRQNEDIKIKAKSLKSWKITRVLFGFQGTLGSKNYKRNKKKYRATVNSLIISIVLFISASSFQSYLSNEINSYVGSSNFDISTVITQKVDNPTGIFGDMMKIEEINQGTYYQNLSGMVGLKKDHVSKKLADYALKNNLGIISENSDEYTMGAQIFFIQDEYYEQYLKENNLDVDRYMSTEQPEALIRDQVKLVNEKGQLFEGDILNTNASTFSFKRQKSFDGYELEEVNEVDGKMIYIYEATDGSGKKKELKEEDAFTNVEFKGSERMKKDFLFVDTSVAYEAEIQLFYPYSAAKKIVENDTDTDFHMCFKAKEHAKAASTMQEVLSKYNISRKWVDDRVQEQTSQRALLSIVRLCEYGFIILISLIAIANVFNTISTNVALRKREFAMLKSVGMTPKEFRRMMNFECILYGMKSLLIGLPISVAATYGMYRVVNGNRMIDTTFNVPWTSMGISILGVFLIVFATMFYAMRKINKENPMEALRNENI